MNAEPLRNFMAERHNIYLRRKSGQLPPWTDDKVLQTYRFCNVYRELDTVTVWIREHIREPYARHPNLWFMLCIARQINLPETLQELMDGGAWPTKTWDPVKARKIMLARQSRGDQLYTGAYMMNAHGRGPEDPSDKAFFTCHLVLDSVWQDRKTVASQFEVGMREAHAALLPFHGWGGFTAYEVVCDARYTRYGAEWVDINSFAHAGPGAVRGLNRLLGRETRESMRAEVALEHMGELLEAVSRKWPRKWPKLELREIEHSLCEYDKWQRVLTGEGRPRAKFKPKENA